MAIEITNRWITLRVDGDGATGALHALASDGERSASSSVDIELPKSLVKELQAVITEHSGRAEGRATADLYESIKADGPNPDGPPSIKLEGSISMAGDPGKESK